VHQKSGAGLRIEYKFINQSKQCIEKSLTDQNKCTKSWCRLVHVNRYLAINIGGICALYYSFIHYSFIIDLGFHAPACTNFWCTYFDRSKIFRYTVLID
jgi:hypothetical protein